MDDQELRTTVAVIGESIPRIEKTVDQINSTLSGKDGLITQVEVNKGAIKRIWWLVGLSTAGLFGLAFFVLRKVL